MKKNTLLFLLFFIILCGCSDDNFDTFNDNQNETKTLKSSLIIEPGEWENWDEIKLTNLSQKVHTPWNKNYAISSIPDNIRKDIKAEDGWILLRNTIQENKPLMNYLIFYNKFNGILKGFYYLENASPGNNGFWNISFDGGTQKLLNNQDGFFTYPHSTNKNIKEVNIMNITQNPTKGFSIGWNCFQVELTYDQSQPNITLLISPYSQNIGSIKLEGAYNSTSSGTIISSTSQVNNANPFLKSTLTAVSDSAKNWIINNISTVNYKYRPIKNVTENTLQAIVKGNIKTLINLASNSIFGSFLGSTGNSTTNYNLLFKTSGTATLQGTTAVPQTTAVPPLQISINSTENLGIWNLINPPVIKLGKFAEMTRYIFSPQTYICYNVNKSLISDRGNLVTNPNISNYIYINNVTFAMSKGHLDGENYNSTSLSKIKFKSTNKVNVVSPINQYTDTLYQGGKTVIALHKNWQSPYNLNFECLGLPELPKWRVDRPALNLQLLYEDGQLYMDPNEDVKVTLIYTININGVDKVFKSIRTYDPEYVFYPNLTGRPYGWTWSEIYANYTLNKYY